jgi:hypothetical protein
LNDVLGEYVAHVSVIEYQKRDLPHSHTLLWVKQPPNTPERIDDVIPDVHILAGSYFMTS